VSWAIGFDERWQRDVGYGVVALCDHPVCGEEIHRGLSYVCGGDMYGGERGCGLYFCYEHLLTHARLPQLCERCSKRKKSFTPKPDVLLWTYFKMIDPSWEAWRVENGLTKDAVY
jgi:hypothetical protein